MRVIPDDELYRVNTVWLGPSGLTLPWTARYMAYAVWLLLFLFILLIERITPLSVGVPPIWEICLTTLLTYAAMGLVDHERPIKAVWETFRADLTAPRAQHRVKRFRSEPTMRVRERRTAGHRFWRRNPHPRKVRTARRAA